MSKYSYYSPQTKLRNVFSRVCKSFFSEGVGEDPMVPLPMMHWTLLYSVPWPWPRSLPDMGPHCTSPRPPPYMDYGWQVGGMHPTGMRSCLFIKVNTFVRLIFFDWVLILFCAALIMWTYSCMDVSSVTRPSTPIQSWGNTRKLTSHSRSVSIQKHSIRVH